MQTPTWLTPQLMAAVVTFTLSIVSLSVLFGVNITSIQIAGITAVINSGISVVLLAFHVPVAAAKAAMRHPTL